MRAWYVDASATMVFQMTTTWSEFFVCRPRPTLVEMMLLCRSRRSFADWRQLALDSLFPSHSLKCLHASSFVNRSVVLVGTWCQKRSRYDFISMKPCFAFSFQNHNSSVILMSIRKQSFVWFRQQLF